MNAGASPARKTRDRSERRAARAIVAGIEPVPQPARSASAVERLYAATLFLGAALLFMVEPMFARLALPLLGGSASVWTTAMVFFQMVLLVAYAYAHVATRRLDLRVQPWIHLAVLLLPLVTLPVSLPRNWDPPTGGTPFLWLIGLFAVGVGLPFFAVATNGPLLQAWYARSGRRSAADPYFLFAASNAGSMLGLLAYPFVVEPRLTLSLQRTVWIAGYGVMWLMTLACAWALHRAMLDRGSEPAGAATAEPARAADAVGWRRRLRWLALAFVPSSLVLGVTQHLSTDIAAVPLLWVVPLAIYLASFVVAFGRGSRAPLRVGRFVLPFALVALGIVLNGDVRDPLSLAITFPLAVLFVVALVCHGALADDRPGAGRLTEFYLVLTVGGALGGVFNALVAPRLFTTIFEYPLALVLAALVAPPPRPAAPSARARMLDVVFPLALAGAALGLAALPATNAARLPAFTIPIALGIVVLAFRNRPVRFALGLLALIVINRNTPGFGGKVIDAERTFYGVHRVVAARAFHFLYHGSTQHGIENGEPGERGEPLSYYYRGGPIGEVFETIATDVVSRRVGVVGLGSGTLAAYTRSDEEWTFYELDPAVLRIASNPRLFTYLNASRTPVRVVLGDGRRSLAADPMARFDLLVIDAYSSDAIPVHLLTREALAVYVAHLAPHGVLELHLSNRYFDLIPVVARLAADAGLACRIRDDPPKPIEDERRGWSEATAAVLARSDADFGALASDPRWRTVAPPAHMRAWTDDYSSLFSVIQWR